LETVINSQKGQNKRGGGSKLMEDDAATVKERLLRRGKNIRKAYSQRGIRSEKKKGDGKGSNARLSRIDVGIKRTRKTKSSSIRPKSKKKPLPRKRKTPSPFIKERTWRKEAQSAILIEDAAPAESKS